MRAAVRSCIEPGSASEVRSGRRWRAGSSRHADPDVERVTGIPARTFRQWATAHVADFTSPAEPPQWAGQSCPASADPEPTARRPAAGAERPSSPTPQRWLILAVIATAQLVVVLDTTVMNVALPSAQRGLRFSNIDRQWIVTAQALSFGSLLFGGRLRT